MLFYLTFFHWASCSRNPSLLWPVAVASFFLLPSSTRLCGNISVSLFIHLLMSVWVVSSVGPLWTKRPHPYSPGSFCGHLHSLLWGKSIARTKTQSQSMHMFNFRDIFSFSKANNRSRGWSSVGEHLPTTGGPGFNPRAPKNSHSNNKNKQDSILRLHQESNCIQH